MRTSANHLALGRRGEQLAARYLWEKEKLVAVSQNWRCSEGELDLVLTNGRTVVICEVKTRTSDNFGTPAEAVSDEKANRIRRLARRWVHAHRMEFWPDLRFDIVSILWPPGQVPVVSHVPKAF